MSIEDIPDSIICPECFSSNRDKIEVVDMRSGSCPVLFQCNDCKKVWSELYDYNEMRYWKSK